LGRSCGGRKSFYIHAWERKWGCIGKRPRGREGTVEFRVATERREGKTNLRYNDPSIRYKWGKNRSTNLMGRAGNRKGNFNQESQFVM